MLERRQAWRRLAVLLAAMALLLNGCRSASWSPDSKTLALDVNDDVTGHFIDDKSMERHDWQSLTPCPDRSPDGRMIALFPLQDPKSTRLELRLCNIATGGKADYVLPE